MVGNLKSSLNTFKLSFTDGSYYHYDLGIRENANFSLSNAFPVIGGTKISVTTQIYANVAIGYFDENGTVVGQFKDAEATGATGIKTYILTVPELARTVRFSCGTSNKGNASIQYYDTINGINSVISQNTTVVKQSITESDKITGYLIGVNGRAYGAADWDCTDYIEIFPEETLVVNAFLLGTGGFCIYDENKTALIGVVGNNASDYGGESSDTKLQKIELNTPSGARYIRLCTNRNSFAITRLYIQYNTVWSKEAVNVLSKVNGVEDVAKGYRDKKVLVLGDSISSDAYGEYKKWVTDLIDEGKFALSKVTNSSQHATGFVSRYNN